MWSEAVSDLHEMTAHFAVIRQADGMCPISEQVCAVKVDANLKG
jgi:hypothetical protein